MGQFLPRHLTGGAAALPLKAAALVDELAARAYVVKISRRDRAE